MALRLDRETKVSVLLESNLNDLQDTFLSDFTKKRLSRIPPRGIIQPVTEFLPLGFIVPLVVSRQVGSAHDSKFWHQTNASSAVDVNLKV